MEIIKDKIKTRECIENCRKLIKIEQSYIIPDIKPDIIKSIVSNGNVYVEKAELQTRRMKIDGKLLTFNMYLDSEENNNNLDTEMEFSEIIDINSNMENMDYDIEVRLNNIELKILNERKVNIVANIMIEAKIYTENEAEIINDVIEKENKIQKLENKIMLENLLGCGNTKINVKENIKLTDVEKILNIVKIEYDIGNLESKISYNKVLVKGEIDLRIYYRNEENKINKYTTKLPVMGFIDILDVNENNICKLKMNIGKLNIALNSETATDLEMDINCRCEVYENKELNIIEDMYGIKENYRYEKRNINLGSENVEKILSKNINEKVLVDNINQLYDTKAEVAITNKKSENGIVKYNGRVNVTYIYDTFDNKNIDSMPVAFDFEFELPEDEKDVELAIENSNFIILPDSSIDNRVEVAVLKRGNSTRKIEVLERIEPDDKIDIPSTSLVIYFVQKGDSLWKIAKKFRSTIELIARINNIENVDKIDVGQKLYIPKAV